VGRNGKLHLSIWGTSVVLLNISISPTQASPISYGFFRVPNTRVTEAAAVNNFGVIAGWYLDPDGSRDHGFIRSADGLSYTSIDFPGSGVMSTSVYGINDEGDVSGTYYDGSLHGFIRTSNGVYTSINLGPHTVVSGINNNGQVFGSTDINQFIRNSDGNYITFSVAGIEDYGGINDSGVVTASAGPGESHGYIRLPNGAITIFDAPGFEGTYAYGINNLGDVVGWGFESGFSIGYVRSADGNTYTLLQTSLAPDIRARGVNDLGEAVGIAFGFGNGVLQVGFCTGPCPGSSPVPSPEPSSMSLAVVGIIAVFFRKTMRTI